MNLDKLDKLAGIGSFLIGVVLVIHDLSGNATTSPNGGLSAPSIHWSTWAFGGVLVLAGFLHFAASRTALRPRLSSIIERPKLVDANGKNRVFLGPDITPEFLAAHFDEHTHLQAEKMVEIYLGKWMRAAGVVRNVMGGDSP